MRLRDRLRFIRRGKEYVRDLEQKAGVILFLGAALAGTVAILVLKGCE